MSAKLGVFDSVNAWGNAFLKIFALPFKSAFKRCPSLLWYNPWQPLTPRFPEKVYVLFSSFLYTGIKSWSEKEAFEV